MSVQRTSSPTALSSAGRTAPAAHGELAVPEDPYATPATYVSHVSGTPHDTAALMYAPWGS